MDEAQLQILRHALGTGDRGVKAAYRNYFVTGPGSKDYANCMALVESGHMTRRLGNAITGGGDIFTVTQPGKLAARPAPLKPMTRAQRCYRRWLDSDSGLSFGEFLRRGGHVHG